MTRVIDRRRSSIGERDLAGRKNPPSGEGGRVMTRHLDHEVDHAVFRTQRDAL
jgi:hypothetical protein